MIKYKQQDVILVDFGFSEETGYKKRPALIISSEDIPLEIERELLQTPKRLAGVRQRFSGGQI